MREVRGSSCAKACGALISATVVSLSLSVSSVHATTILSGPATPVAPGSSFTVDLGDDFTSFMQSDISLGLDVDVIFDQSQLNFVANSQTDAGGVYDGWLIGANVIGTLTAPEMALASGFSTPAGEEISICCGLGVNTNEFLFSLDFAVPSGANPGSTSVFFTTDANAEVGGGALANLEYPVSPDPSSILIDIAAATVTPVPEPPSGTLFLVGFAAVLAFGRRFFARRRAVPA